MELMLINFGKQERFFGFLPVLGAAWAPVLEKFDLLRRAGVTATMVAANIFGQCLALLQARPYPLWFSWRTRKFFAEASCAPLL